MTLEKEFSMFRSIPSTIVLYIIEIKCNTYSKLTANQNTHEIFI